MNEERKLSKAKITLMRSAKFALLQGVMMVGTTSIAEGVPTAYTDGRDEVYGREFVKSLSDKELAFVVAHETMHKMYRHLFVWKRLHEENPRLTNIAADHVINLELLDLDPHGELIAMPTYKDGPNKGKRIGVADPRFRGMDTKQVYDILKQEQEERGQGGEGDGQPVDGDQPGQGKGNGQPENDGGLDGHDWSRADDMTAEEKADLDREIDAAIRQGIAAQKARGQKAGGLSRELEDLLTPKLDWREVLRDFVKSACRGNDTSSWRRVNRRYIGEDIYMPAMISERIGRMVIGIDTSGSIGGPELTAFLTEVQAIAEEVHPEYVDLLYWDARVAAHEEYSEGSVTMIAQSTKPAGGGGTAPSCVSEWLAANPQVKPDVIVMFTDGFVGSDWGSGWTAPLLWVIDGHKTAMADHGQTIHM